MSSFNKNETDLLFRPSYCGPSRGQPAIHFKAGATPPSLPFSAPVRIRSDHPTNDIRTWTMNKANVDPRELYHPPPGPVWTPLIPSTLPAEKVKQFGSDTLFGRAAQPAELAPVFVFLASHLASYVTGEVYGVTGGQMPL